MLNFVFLEKGLGIAPHYTLSMIFLEQCFSYYTLLTDQILVPYCLYFLRYSAICVLQLFVNQVVTS